MNGGGMYRTHASSDCLELLLHAAVDARADANILCDEKSLIHAHASSTPPHPANGAKLSSQLPLHSVGEVATTRVAKQSANTKQLNDPMSIECFMLVLKLVSLLP